MFQFPRFPSAAYVFSCRCCGITRSGFPHSDIPGSKPACGSPRRIGACPVLHRPPAPRHPPCALSNLTFSSMQFSRCLGFIAPSKPNSASLLLRKEVIQPHLPIRLPCYDFTPITCPTFDGSPLTVGPPASGVASFRGVTGGVYKARERIHRGMLTRDY